MYYKSNGMTGEEFGYLMATGVSQMPGSRNGKRRDEFECVCGRRKFIQPSAVASGMTKSCGCMARKIQRDLIEARREAIKAMSEAAIIPRNKQIWALKLFAGVAA